MLDGGHCGFPCLWESWKEVNVFLMETFRIIKTDPNEVMKTLNKRPTATIEPKDSVAQDLLPI